MSLLSITQNLLQNITSENGSKIVGTATGAGVGVKTVITQFDWQLFTIQTTISIVIASTIGYTITWMLGRLYKRIEKKFKNQDAI